MLHLSVETIGQLSVIECKGRIVQSDAAFRLRAAVTSHGDSRIIVLDISEVSAIEGGGLGMLVFLDQWARDHAIDFKLCAPMGSVLQRLKLIRPIRAFDIISRREMMSLLAVADSDFALAA